MNEIERFAKLFDGLDRAYGRYDLGESEGSKVGGAARTIREPLTLQHFIDHIEGRAGLGVIPIRDDGTCVFAAADIDEYPLDLPGLNAKIQRLGLPLVPCQSKSGGAHVYLFLLEPAPARDVVAKMQQFAAALDHPSCEIFPKQLSLKGGDVGNWINLPYFNAGGPTMRYALGAEGKALIELCDFLDFAESKRVSLSDLPSVQAPASAKPEPDLPAEGFEDGPPCIQKMIDAKLGDGDGRNNACMHFTVFAKKKYPQDWKGAVRAFNAELGEPLSDRELESSVLKSGSRCDYGFKCDDRPMKSYCDRVECRKRKYGIGGNGDEEADAATAELNEQYFVVTRGNKVAICEPYVDGETGRWLYRYLGKEDFSTLR